MATSPHIIFNIIAHQYYGNNASGTKSQIAESDFYRCKNPGYNAVNYLSRKEAVEAHDIETSEVVQKLINQTDANENDILSYTKDRPGSTGLWNKNGDLTKEQVDDLRTKLSQTESVVWSSVISFSESYGKQNCGNKSKAHQVVSKTIDSFFLKAGLDPNNITWYGAYHMNTDNPHIHLVFFENSPERLNSKGEISHTPWNLPRSSFTHFKEKIAFEFRENKPAYYSWRDEIRNSVSHNLKKDTSLYSELKEVQSKLSDAKSVQYNRLTSENKKLVSSLTHKIIDKDPTLSQKYDNYIDAIRKEQVELVSLYKENKIPIPKKVRNYASSRIDDFHNRLYNTTYKGLLNMAVINTDISGASTPEKSSKEKNYKKQNIDGQKKQQSAARSRRGVNKHLFKRFMLAMNKALSDDFQTEESNAALRKKAMEFDFQKYMDSISEMEDVHE